MAGTIQNAKLRRTLEHKLGFEPKDGKQPHTKYRLYINGQYVAHTQVPRSGTKIETTLQGLIAKQLGVNVVELNAIVECTIDREHYLSKVAAS